MVWIRASGGGDMGVLAESWWAKSHKRAAWEHPFSVSYSYEGRFPLQSLSPELGTDVESELRIFRTELVRGVQGTGFQKGPRRMLVTETGRCKKSEVHTQVINGQGTGGGWLRVYLRTQDADLEGFSEIV